MNDARSTDSASRLLQRQMELWQEGDRPSVEDLIGGSSVATDDELVLDLIYGEIRLKADLGEVIEKEAYLRRFPSLSDRISRLFEVHEAIGGSDTQPSQFDADTKSITCSRCNHVQHVDGSESEGSCTKCGAGFQLSLRTTDDVALETRIGQFQLIRVLGSGHNGVVWQARDTRLNREVAVKWPKRVGDQKVTKLFLKEARAAASLKHPNIVPVYDVGVDGGTIFIVSSFIRGVTLAEMIRQRRFSPTEAAGLCQKIASAIHYAHQAGLIHRDLKPGNILLDVDGEPHVTDFGLAKHLNAPGETATANGELLGTPAYMAPEQARGEANRVTATTDVYAIGVILYELLTQKRPFDGDLRVLLYRILTAEPDSPRSLNRSIPRDLETICLKAMAKRKEDRYSSAQELSEDLGRYLKGECIQARPATLLRRALIRAKRVSPAFAGIAAAGVLLGVILSWGAQRPPDDEIRQNPQSSNLEIVGGPQPPSDAWRHEVLITTEPPGAKVVLYQLDFETARPNPDTRTELKDLTPARAHLTSGQYLVVAYNDHGAFHEVMRSVPRRPFEKWGPYYHETWKWDEGTQTVEWPKIKLFPSALHAPELAMSNGAEEFSLDMTSADGEFERWKIPPFAIQTTELTVAQQEGFGGASAGRQPDFPAVRLSWNSAMAYAEAHGLRLPDLVEVEFLAATAKRKCDDPQRMDSDWSRPVTDRAADVLETTPAVYGISSGALEWTGTRSQIRPQNDSFLGCRYIIRGGPAALIGNGIVLDQNGRWASVNQEVRPDGVGVRCARSRRARLSADNLLTRLPNDEGLPNTP